MNVNSIKTTVSDCAKNTIKALNEVGSFTRNGASQAIKFAQDKKDVFVSSELGKKAKDCGISKDTLIGLGVSAATVALAIKCIIEIKDKIKEMKSK